MSDSGQVAVIIPAAGQGTRLGGHRKQFRVLGGKSVLVQTLLVFERHAKVDHIIVATPEDAVDPLRVELRRVGISKLLDVVPGGETRQDTVREAIEALPDGVDVVLIHDAVRPFVRMSRVSAVIETTRLHGASSLALSITDTVRRIAGEPDGEIIFGETVPREELVRVQTPQGFRPEWLRKAHDAADKAGIHATDDVDLVQRQGHRVFPVTGSVMNIKITTPEDWDTANRYWPDWMEILEMEEREQIVGQETR
ncbi:MAG: 2-C-methyl-D-erythritol 4-phosphate cytidylyltransferase [Bacteroidetes bacterium]|nr:2-C-methyl-D-erythritol 4-phosphate cytidylyltransferase [Bacteroidota bacterium]MDA1334156.1 2-C-methyl-D-erythritol 4-phosphate cytidylyltransferase [Bacteroidota bacterium]